MAATFESPPTGSADSEATAAPKNAKSGPRKRFDSKPRPKRRQSSPVLASAAEATPQSSTVAVVPANVESSGEPVSESPHEVVRAHAYLRENVAFSRDKSDYWRKTADGTFCRTREEDLKRHLRKDGFFVGTCYTPGITLFDQAVTYAQDNCHVTTVFNLAGHKPGIYTTREGRRVLVPDGMRPMEIAQGEFPETVRLLEELFGESQIDYALAWLQSALVDLRSGDPDRWRSSHLLCLVGDPGCGKSMFQTLVTEWLNGGEADPFDMLMGSEKGKFTQDLANATHWRMEDKPPIFKLQSRAAFSETIKHHCVSKILEVHAKGRDKIQLPTFRRMTLSTNEDSSALTVLPALTSGILDKLLILRCSKATNLGPDYHANISKFRREMPGFRHFLLHGYVVPDALRADADRMGFHAFINADVRNWLDDADPRKRFLEILEAVLFEDDDSAGPRVSFRGTATDIQQRLCAHGKWGAMARQLLPSTNICGHFIRDIAKEHPSRFKETRPKGVSHWTIDPP